MGPRNSWYALYTKHQHEKVVAQQLTYKGFDVFLPLYAVARDWKDRVKVLQVPLFPSYVFLRGADDRQLAIITTPGIHDFVRSGSGPAPIPDAEIEGIRQAIGSGARVEPHPFLACGNWVRVTCGPLAGVQGVLVRRRSAYRLVLSVDMLGKAAAVEIDALSVERVVHKHIAGRGISNEQSQHGPTAHRIDAITSAVIPCW